MNSFIETFNLWGDRILTFAWPMLWQSSLLIAVLFATDFVLRRRVRPAVRCTLWLVLLVKLLMPPSLALPTSIAWWIRTNPQSPQRPAEPQRTFVVTYGDTVQSEPLPVAQNVEHPRPKPSTAAWLLAGWSLGSFGLLGVLLIRWRQITIEIRQTEPAPDWTEELFNNVRRELNWRQSVRLRLTNRAMSPAVCGFFRPTILLPRALIERLEPNQLRAVLLHELIHLRRGDVWVNCAQALIQVFYWWHPLLWLANARIRRVREEAVDDAVMLALRDNAENYAPTLLEVAKLAFSRPLASLGLVGILESRNALRQRIERLVNFRAPRHAGLTLASTFGIIAFAAIAAPMNRAPETSVAVLPPPRINDGPWPDPDYPGYKNLNIEAAYFLIEDSKLRELFPAFNSEKPGSLQIGQDIVEFRHRLKQVGGREISPSPTFQQFSGGRFHWRINGSATSNENQIIYQTQRIGDRDIVVGCDAILHLPDWSSQEFTLTPWAEGDAIQCEISTTGWGGVVNLGMLLRTNETGFWAVPNVSPGICQVVALHGSVSTHTNLPKANASNGEPETSTKLKSAASGDSSAPYSFSSDFPASNRASVQREPMAITAERISFDVNTRRLEADGDVRIQSDGRTITTDHAVISPDTRTNSNASSDGSTVISGNSADNPNNKQIEPLYTRTFKVGTNAFYRALVERAGLTAPVESTNIAQSVHTLIASTGIDLQPPKSIYYNYRNGMLLVRAALKDLDSIEHLVLVLNETLPQVNIRATFVEVPAGESIFLGNLSSAAPSISSNSPSSPTGQGPARVASFTGILTEPQRKAVFKALETNPQVTFLSMPRVTTLSGRQAQIQMVEMRTIVKGLTTTVTNGETKVDYHTSPMQFGPVLDVIPYVSADGYTIQLTAIPTVTEFLGYDDPRSFMPHFTNLTEKAHLPLPRFRVRQITTSANVWDNQTLVLGNFSDQTVVKKPDGTSNTNSFTGQIKKQLFVFITPTLIDPAGNRIHKDEEMPFARDQVRPPPK